MSSEFMWGGEEKDKREGWRDRRVRMEEEKWREEEEEVSGENLSKTERKTK